MLIKEDVRMPVVEVAAGQVWITTVTVQIMRGVGQGKTKKVYVSGHLVLSWSCSQLSIPHPHSYMLFLSFRLSCQDGVFSQEYAV